MNRFFRKLNSIIFTSFLITALFLGRAEHASAQTMPWRWDCVNNGVATIQGLECLIANVFMVIITLTGFSAFIMFIVAGFRWMLSGGNSKGMESARNTMTFAVVGIVVSLSAYIILNLISDFTGITEILRFEIPRP